MPSDRLSWILDYTTEGDLFFFGRLPDSDAKDFEKAVLSAGGSKRQRGSNISHVGVVVRRSDENAPLRIAHATRNGVFVQTLPEVLIEIEHPDEIQVYSVEVNEEAKQAASQFALSKVGCVYNDIFSKECRDSKGTEAYYCSQLVTEAYKEVAVGFPPHKMSFGDTENEVDNYWVEYYKERKCAIPVGEEGSHPGKMVDAEKLKLIMSVSMTSKLTSSLVNFTETLHRPHWIDGLAVELQGGIEFDVMQPHSGTVVARVSGATHRQTLNAISIAQAAQPEWAEQTWSQRGEVLNKTAKLIREYIEQLTRAECEDTGKTIKETRMDIIKCAETFEFYSGIEALMGDDPLDFSHIRKKPLAVIGCIGVPNRSLLFCIWNTAPALIAGNTVVYKPSPLAPVSSRLLGEILKEAGLPDGVFNVVQGDEKTDSAIFESPDVEKVFYSDNTSSVAGKHGSKSAHIILDDSSVSFDFNERSGREKLFAHLEQYTQTKNI